MSGVSEGNMNKHLGGLPPGEYHAIILPILVHSVKVMILMSLQVIGLTPVGLVCVDRVGPCFAA
jgi:hypothetical protein